MTEELFRQFARRFERDHAHGFVGFGVEKSRGQFAEITVLERPLAQPAARNRVDGVSRATIDLDEDDQSFAELRLFYAHQTASQHGHSHTKDLPRTHMPMILFSLGEVFSQGIHRLSQKINHEETKNTKRDQKKPSCSSFLRG